MEEDQYSRRRYLSFLAALAVGGAGCSGLDFQDESTPSNNAHTGNVTTASPETTGTRTTTSQNGGSSIYTRIYRNIVGSVVRIRVSTGEREGLGSGFVFDGSHIITNYHVVKNTRTVEVQFTRGESRIGTVVGTDAYTDLAAVSVSNRPGYAKPLPLLKHEPAVGQKVAAIGSPYGLEGSLSTGVVSGVNRLIPSPGSTRRIPGGIQTDAAVNPGNSGGPLVTLDGKVIGIISSGGGDNIAFAVPASLVERVVPSLIKNGNYQHPHMGAQLRDVTQAVRKAYGLSNTRGMLVVATRPGSPAAGVLRGSTGRTTVSGIVVPTGCDIIRSINGTKMTSTRDILTYLIFNTSPGETLRITLLRDGERTTVELTLGVRPSS